MSRYQSLQINGFRCFAGFELKNLERINLITGVNNVGKTTLLEALFLHCGGYNPELILRLKAFRGIETVRHTSSGSTDSPLSEYFADFDVTKEICIVGKEQGGRSRFMKLAMVNQPDELDRISIPLSGKSNGAESNICTADAYEVLKLVHGYEQAVEGSCYLIFDTQGAHLHPRPPLPRLSASFQTSRAVSEFAEDAERFGNLELRGRHDLIRDALQILEPRLTRVTTVAVGGKAMLHGDIGLSRLVPFAAMGEGIVRLASTVLRIGNMSGGVVLVDEIENGLHHSILQKVWRAIGDAAREFDTQVFATTHSYECAAAAHRAFSEGEEDEFRLHRLERIDGKIQAKSYDHETLEAAIGMNLEVR